MHEYGIGTSTNGIVKDKFKKLEFGSGQNGQFINRQISLKN